MSPDPPVFAGIDTTVPHSARRYNYWLGGKDHFAVDRESGEQMAAVFPTARVWAVQNRAYLRRVVTYLAREAGIRQFLDVGTGLPTADNTHEVAQRIAPESRVVYVDNDPLVMTHARALLTSTRQGLTSYLEADLRNPAVILEQARETLDFSQPVALMLIAVLHFVPDAKADSYAVVRTLVEALPAGSYLAISHGSADYLPAPTAATLEAMARAGGEFQLRSASELARYFDGMSLVDPGIAVISEWRPLDDDRPDPADVACLGAVARVG
ncbi:SAM-dependent methyltransferase [Cryptosporangium phraense]|uniref:SAM-dependent methyltransferase n=1 Tax=Cryptosporangium phraense TaxID=2593070 RepID=A0A545ANP2_9ACTN|nr:SAM-dependent methyltransferase [Cryptosporangium phraense]TQS42964.1 SAM-dependent methyltransferase [Cryptosporangium phraense]